VVHGESWCVQAPVVARRPLVCQAAAEVVEAETAEPKGGVAHLRFKRGSVHKVGSSSREMAAISHATGRGRQLKALKQLL
jgi:hypothetical protein